MGGILYGSRQAAKSLTPGRGQDQLEERADPYQLCPFIYLSAITKVSIE